VHVSRANLKRVMHRLRNCKCVFKEQRKYTITRPLEREITNAASNLKSTPNTRGSEGADTPQWQRCGTMTDDSTEEQWNASELALLRKNVTTHTTWCLWITILLFDLLLLDLRLWLCLNVV
jgi:hypothetical protein